MVYLKYLNFIFFKWQCKYGIKTGEMRTFIEQDNYTTQQIFTMDKSWLFVEKSQLGHIFQKKAKVLRLWKIAWCFCLGPVLCKRSHFCTNIVPVFFNQVLLQHFPKFPKSIVGKHLYHWNI